MAVGFAALELQALEDMAEHISGFPVSNPNKFCHGYGMFQYDLQFFLEDPDYFLEKRYEKFDETLAKCCKELTAKAKKIGLFDKPSLDDMELTAVAIAYNTGTFKPALSLKQGHFNGSRFYGEEIFDFIRMSRTVPVPGGAHACAPESLKAWAKERIAPYKVPREFLLRESLPRNPIGKVVKPELVRALAALPRVGEAPGSPGEPASQ